jgi:anti-anti-sigma factor
MDIEISRGDVVRITLKGRMDAVSSPDFDRALDELMSQGQRQFLLDLSNLEYISSAGLQSLLAAAKRLEQIEGIITLSNLNGAVLEVFQISGFDTLFPILDSRPE